MDKLIAFLLEHLQLDFTGELNIDSVRELLRDDNSSQARALLARVGSEGGVDDMMVTLADCLQEYLRTGITENTVREQLNLYSES